jgi:hypothetical protein
MTPRCFTIEKLVADLGDVCASGDEVRGERTGSEEAVGAALERATEAVLAVIDDSGEDDDQIVRTAWDAIAQARDCIGRLRRTVAHARTLRDRAQTLQEQSLGLRSRLESGGGPRRAPRVTDRD